MFENQQISNVQSGREGIQEKKLERKVGCGLHTALRPRNDLLNETAWHYCTVSHPQQCALCSGSVVVTAYDFESGRPGSNLEWGQL